MDDNIVKSEIYKIGGVPALVVNGKPVTPFAYMTYFEKFNCYSDFTETGTKLFSVPVMFAGRWIRANTPINPLKKGIFDLKSSPDYSLFNEAINKIISVCPDAMIIPRVNMSLPEWWENENPDEVNITENGSCRESFYSSKWLNDAREMLVQFISYVESSRFAVNIIGYQLSSGTTEEWFHFDLNAGRCKNAEAGFKAFINEKYPDISFRGVPELTPLKSEKTFLNNEYLSLFLEYASYATASAITQFAKAAKESCKNRVVIGAFYGYTLEVSSSLWGTHALKLLLENENIDFICSPNSYIGIRSPTIDWSEMYPADSVRLHGKMCFQECDIRTYLSSPPGKKAPDIDPFGIISGPVWLGPETQEESINNIKKSFYRQLIKGNGLWWFDMWGGWYKDEKIMKNMEHFRALMEDDLKNNKRSSDAEIAVFVDEASYKYLSDCSFRNAAFNQRCELGIMGAPFDFYDVFDFDKVKSKYKAFIFLHPFVTENAKNALTFTKENAIPFLAVSEDKQNFTVSELRSFLKENGIHLYCETADILYINNNYAALFAVTEGEKTINLGRKCKIKELLCKENAENISTQIRFSADKFCAYLFKTDPIS